MTTNTNPARGMRDFLPLDVRRREYVIGIIKEVYESYGFEPLETPAVENLETLTGKYGEEGSQLIFKILKRGEKLSEELNEGKIKSENELSDLALRYDLTVPLARVVANHKNELPKFFKRYQIQPVWRADRPARGRFREFYQCDVDAIGSKSMIVEAELISAVCEILQKLKFKDFKILINHRKILTGIMDVMGIAPEKQTSALVALDKLDKIGVEGVTKDLEAVNIKIDDKPSQKPKKLSFWQLMVGKAREEDSINERNQKTLENIQSYIQDNAIGDEGVRDLTEIQKFILETDNGRFIDIDPSLARGLSYYTGAIFEINVPDLAGSLGGGGRYDGLIGMFGKEEIPACGFSLGLERILVVMAERGMFPPELSTNAADVLVTVWSEETAGESLKLANDLRRQGLRVFVYPETDKLGKQFKYAAQINVPFVCVLGESELAENTVTLKNMQSGEQEKIARDAVADKLRNYV